MVASRSVAAAVPDDVSARFLQANLPAVAGYLPLEPDAAHLFFQLVSRRYERGAILITSNRSVGEWGTVFGDAVVATAILDRLLHHSHVVTIRGDSYRLKEKPRSGLLQKAAAAEAKLIETPKRGVSTLVLCTDAPFALNHMLASRSPPPHKKTRRAGVD
jgi:hypothetical protein